jgi:hypothetical protein
MRTAFLTLSSHRWHKPRRTHASGISRQRSESKASTESKRPSGPAPAASASASIQTEPCNPFIHIANTGRVFARLQPRCGAGAGEKCHDEHQEREASSRTR